MSDFDISKVLSYVPVVIESSSRGEKSFDIFSRLLRERIIFLGDEIDDELANIVVAELLLLDSAFVHTGCQTHRHIAAPRYRFLHTSRNTGGSSKKFQDNH